MGKRFVLVLYFLVLFTVPAATYWYGLETGKFHPLVGVCLFVSMTIGYIFSPKISAFKAPFLAICFIAFGFGVHYLARLEVGAFSLRPASYGEITILYFFIAFGIGICLPNLWSPKLGDQQNNSIPHS